jgi:hypothetical protein
MKNATAFMMYARAPKMLTVGDKFESDGKTFKIAKIQQIEFVNEFTLQVLYWAKEVKENV